MLHVAVQYSDCGLARSSVYFPAMQSVKVWQKIHCKEKKKKKKKASSASFMECMLCSCVRDC